MSSPSRFSLSGLLIGIAILSVFLAFGVYAAISANFALEAENNLQAYLHTADALNAFVERHRRWPRDEAELREFDGQPAGWPKLQDYALGRSIVAYDFDLSRESLDSPETFRGLRYKEPSFRSSGAVIDNLLATLRALRDAQAAPVPVGQALPDDAEETSAGDEGGSREGASESDAALK